MNSNNYQNEIFDNDDNQHVYRICTERSNKSRQTSPPNVYEQTITTTTTTTTTNQEVNSIIDEMTTTHLEKSPIRQVNLVTGPQSAYARLFPEKYRCEQEEIARKQHVTIVDDQRYDFDRAKHPRPPSSHHTDDVITKTRRVSFLEQLNDEFTSNECNAEPSTPYHPDELSRIPLNYDPNPEIIHRDNPNKVVYLQKIGIRYLKPPTPPPPEPIIVREVQSTPLPEPPPLVISTAPPDIPRTPSPLIVREEPPPPPEPLPPQIITKTLPPPPPPPRRVIIKRAPPLPPKPRPIIIEKWLPYKAPPERAVIYERVKPSAAPICPGPRNVIYEFEPPQVRIQQEIQNAGCFRVDPEIYRTKYASSLRHTNSIRKVLQDIGCDPNLITSARYETCYVSNQNSHSLSSHQQHPKQVVSCFTDEQLSALIRTAAQSNQQQNLQSIPTQQNTVYYTRVVPNN